MFTRHPNLKVTHWELISSCKTACGISHFPIQCRFFHYFFSGVIVNNWNIASFSFIDNMWKNVGREYNWSAFMFPWIVESKSAMCLTPSKSHFAALQGLKMAAIWNYRTLDQLSSIFIFQSPIPPMKKISAFGNKSRALSHSTTRFAYKNQ